MTVLSTSVIIGGIQNPISFKPSDTFKIRTYSAYPSLTNQITSGLAVTMTTAYELSTFSITPQSTVVHFDSKQTLNIQHVIPLSVNDYLLLDFDSTMTVSPTVSCSAISGVSGVTCARMSTSQLKIVYTSLPSSLTIKIDITTVRNYDIA